MGQHCIKTWSKTQAVIAKSSAELEIYGVARGACEGLGIKTRHMDLGTDVGIRLELDAAAAKGIFDRQGIAKVRHRNVNCLWLQEQCAKKIVPMNTIQGKTNIADLMTKHLAIRMILRHMANLNLVHSGGRSEAAAKLHPVEESATPLRTSERAVTNSEAIPKKSTMDYLAEKEEHGSWVRIHVEPRSDRFDPWMASRGPGRKTRLQAIRRTQGTFENGKKFNDEDGWQLETREKGKLKLRDEEDIKWVGTTIFLVDRKYPREYGTDQRRQRTAAANQPTNQSTE